MARWHASSNALEPLCPLWEHFPFGNSGHQASERSARSLVQSFIISPVALPDFTKRIQGEG